ncbi:hypothetical protein [Microvirga antarctica]|uniref:hypothetical protein n=1 Tax=Microvirga antarctica TaxID=2819233 RepID=UPI001B3041B8|nr:hypothetical protein [Microvirga antarctica]
MAKIVTDERARQGPSGRPVLVVLIAAMILCGIAIGGYLTWVTKTSPDSPAQDASRAAITGSPSGSTAPSSTTPPVNSGSSAPATPATPRPATAQ